MTEPEVEFAEALGPGEDDEPIPKKRSYLSRPTIRAIKRASVEAQQNYTSDIRQRLDEDTRLPGDEVVTLGGFVLVEYFTPSNVSSLFEAIEKYPTNRSDLKSEWIEKLARSRGGSGFTWINLGSARRPGEFLVDGFHDASLPEGVDAASLKLFFVTPSLSIITAMFTLSEDVGDLSHALRVDYEPEVYDLEFDVIGPLSSIRERIPWSRPKRYGMSSRLRQAEDHRRKEAQDVMEYFEGECRTWLRQRFPNGIETAGRQPVARLLLTTVSEPFSRDRSLEPGGLAFSPTIWKSTEFTGWKLRIGDSREPRRPLATFAARRRDVARSPGGGEVGDTAWYITHEFDSYQEGLVARWATLHLLETYSNRLATLRDRAAHRGRITRPMKLAIDLDHYVIADGLDSESIASELLRATGDLDSFRWNIAEYSEDVSEYGPNFTQGSRELVPQLMDQTRSRVVTLKDSAQASTGSIQISATLRQAVANTRLQRVLLALTILALIVSTVSLWVAVDAATR